jgi:nitroimidazol reductase NimA-like FMN-containing flavoprotein (pyridoxamine 5'-phosphate oxidase superfamily)
MTDLQSPRTTVRRLAERGRYDRSSIDAILDEALIGQLSFVHDGQPFGLPIIFGRDGDTLYLHGSPASRMLRSITDQPVCFSVALVDALVIARSAFHHSMNYRSVVVLGRPQLIETLEAKRHALDVIVEHVVSGRTAEVRPHTETELRATRVLQLAIDEASAKVRTGGPIDDADDLEGPAWAGLVPVSTSYGAPQDADDLRAGIQPPASVRTYRRPLR